MLRGLPGLSQLAFMNLYGTMNIPPLLKWLPLKPESGDAKIQICAVWLHILHSARFLQRFLYAPKSLDSLHSYFFKTKTKGLY